MHCTVSLTKLGDWLLELHSVQLELAQENLFVIPETKAKALSCQIMQCMQVNVKPGKGGLDMSMGSVQTRISKG